MAAVVANCIFPPKGLDSSKVYTIALPARSSLSRRFLGVVDLDNTIFFVGVSAPGWESNTGGVTFPSIFISCSFT